ncbi:MAG: hypothetical protein ABL918_09345 [Chakrabartia sp.]
MAHSLSVALAVANAGFGIEVIIATTNERIATEVNRLMGPDRPAAITLLALTLKTPTSRTVDALFGKLAPTAKFLIYRDNLDFFGSLDALVVTERTSLVLKTRFGMNALKMFLIDHGAGDRAIGFGKTTALFDHILAAGPKIRDRLISDAGVPPESLTITGYPKFDSVGGMTKPFKFRGSDRPIVLYNPHVSPHLSSWYKQGRAVLDYFLSSDRYNLIFAPHIMMFERRIVVTIDKLSFGMSGRLDPKYAAAPNIHVDLGSAALTNMTYTNIADIYLGDVSSQVYEFLKTPRPCLFVNTHGVCSEGDRNFAHWQAGPVISSVEELSVGLECSLSSHASSYLPIQRSLFAHTFDLTDEPSSIRAARAISVLLGIENVVVENVHALRFAA